MVLFSLQYGPFCKSKWCFLQCEKIPLNINYWYSRRYKNLLYFAYLRPKESHSANTHLFFGVQWETEEEKSKTAFKLKVACIISFQQKITTLTWTKMNLKAALIISFQQKNAALIRKEIHLKATHIASFQQKETTLIWDEINLGTTYIISFQQKNTTLT